MEEHRMGLTLYKKKMLKIWDFTLVQWGRKCLYAVNLVPLSTETQSLWGLSGKMQEGPSHLDSYKLIWEVEHAYVEGQLHKTKYKFTQMKVCPA